jgi:4-amino-4-deoxy-L-arabinose transferase-like glycosyltransferase
MDLKRPVSIALFTLFLAEALLGYIYIPYRAFHSRWIIALVAFLSIACVALLWRTSKAWRSKSIQAMLGAPFAWLTVITGAGLFMRLAWIIAVPPVQISDSLDYWNAAIRLVTEHAYYFQMDGGEVLKAWRPPGLPLILAAMFQTLGPHEWIPTLLNCSAYVATSVLLFVVARRLVDTQAGLISVALLAVHPALIASTGLAVSEPLSLLLYLGCYWTGLAALTRSGWWGLLAGALMALSALVKPEFELLPILWLLFLVVYSPSLRDGLLRFAPVFLAFTLTLMPWVVRNYLLFHRVVLISTNGGDVFYRANNPLASGGFNQTGARELNQYQSDELLWNRTGYQWVSNGCLVSHSRS